MAFRGKILYLPLLLAALFLASCWNPFHPPLLDDSDSSLRNATPLDVLQNLERAYKERNINIYKELLAPDFRFELISTEVGQIGIDVNGDGIRDSWWGVDRSCSSLKTSSTAAPPMAAPRRRMTSTCAC